SEYVLKLKRPESQTSPCVVPAKTLEFLSVAETQQYYKKASVTPTRSSVSR
uniref:Uncharacterized protein n=2 Tax=Aegilops tauschii TaxID=37682 RepID=A0A453LUG1_AEGTS